MTGQSNIKFEWFTYSFYIRWCHSPTFGHFSLISLFLSFSSSPFPLYLSPLSLSRPYLTFDFLLYLLCITIFSSFILACCSLCLSSIVRRLELEPLGGWHTKFCWYIFLRTLCLLKSVNKLSILFVCNRYCKLDYKFIYSTL